jgi:predicted PurR-regulated permease PerM
VINLNLNPVTRWGLGLIGLLAVVILLRLGEAFFIPPVIALLLAAVLWPGAIWLNRWLRLPWSLACLIVLTGLVLLNIAVTFGFALSLAHLLQGMPNPENPAGQEALYTSIRDRVALVSPFPLEADDPFWPKEAKDSRIFQYVQDTIQKNITNVLWKVGYYGNSWIWQWVLILFFLLFFLVEGRMLTRRVVQLLGTSPDVQAKAGEALAAMAHQVRSFLLWRTLINIILGGLLGLFYYVLGLREWFTWALLTAVLCYVPYLGPIAAGVPPILDAFLASPEPWYALVVFAVYLILITVEGYIVVPVVMGRSMEMNATTVLLACLFWELIWGLPGLFMAMPLMAAIKAVCYHVDELRPWANLMGLSSAAEPTPGPPPLDHEMPIPPPAEEVPPKAPTREKAESTQADG